MRRNIRIPRIIKINWIDGLAISVVFNNRESRIIDFKKVLNGLKIDEQSPAAVLLDPDEFSKAEIKNNTLSWINVEQYITMKNNEKRRVPFEIGADVLLKYSKPEKSELAIKIGRLIKEVRLKSGLTQQELALLSGTSRSDISKIENDRSDLALTVLSRIVETGLGKQLDISIK